MFVDNRTHLPVRLARAGFAEHLSVASIAFSVRFGIAPDGALAPLPPTEPRPTDPPDPSRRPLWTGTSVTASGAALGPACAPFVRSASLAVGGATCRIAVFGDRRWERSMLGELVASAPAPFDSMPVSFSRAFGGSYAIEPGLLPGTDLPHPGGVVAHPSNPDGVGFYRDAAAALHRPLPNVEWPDRLVRSPRDNPQPAGLEPCPRLLALRMPASPEAIEAALADPIRTSLRLAHHAPGWLVHTDITVGTPIRLDGLGHRALAFVVPPSPVHVVARCRRIDDEVPFHVRSVHVDAEHGDALVTYGHAFRYDPRWPPRTLRVVARKTHPELAEVGT